jgi:hypothetical protein
MPQLPSGRHVGLSHGRALAMADHYRIDFMMMLEQQHQDKNGILQFVNVVYYEPADDLPNPDHPGLGNPYASDLMASDVMTDKCDWTEDDKTAFMDWVNSERMQTTFSRMYDEIHERFKKAEVPEALRGIFDNDD